MDRGERLLAAAHAHAAGGAYETCPLQPLAFRLIIRFSLSGKRDSHHVQPASMSVSQGGVLIWRYQDSRSLAIA